MAGRVVAAAWVAVGGCGGVTGAGIDGRALRGRSVIRKSCWDRWWLVLRSMP
jgi:hypothetical protein